MRCSDIISNKYQRHSGLAIRYRYLNIEDAEISNAVFRELKEMFERIQRFYNIT